MRDLRTFLASFLVLAACGGSSPPAAAPGAAAPVPVRVEVLAPAPLDRALEATGTIQAIDSAELRPEVQGLVEAVLFEDGQAVRRGAPLVRLRSTDARAALLDAEARAKLSGLDLERKRALFEQGDVAQADIDRAEAEAALARAALQRAQEAVRRTTIAAPFDGVVGLREVAPGELVDPSRRVTRIEALSQLVVDVVLPETALGQLAVGQRAVVRADALPERSFSGAVSYVSPRVSETTRTVDVRVTVEDPEGLLRPGMTAVARVVTASVAEAVMVPTEAVVRSAQGMAVYVVGPDQTVTLRPVRAGERTEDRLEVTDGLAAGETIVVEGLARLRPGATVEVKAAPVAP